MEEKLRLFWEFYAKWCDAPMSMEDFTQKAFLAGWSAAEHSVQADNEQRVPFSGDPSELTSPFKSDLE